MLNKEIRLCLERSVLGWLATVDQQGHPNVSPKEIFAAWDDRTVLIAHIASPLSIVFGSIITLEQPKGLWHFICAFRKPKAWPLF